MSPANDISPPSWFIGLIIPVAIWLFWVVFSDTRHNHGFWVAFLMPLALFFFPLVWIAYVFLKYSTLLAFTVRGRKDEHQEFFRKLTIRSGIFLLFNQN
ncbi:MAG: hypothetical protein D6B25_08980 [Desulfobulbaceae bacterium]|nr:MAG: hypothetical protein D6B25_08980 [Desulfobulbaceae bacterium]